MIVAQTLSPQNIIFSFNEYNEFFSSEEKKTLVNGIKYTLSTIQNYSSERESKLYNVDTRDYLQNMEFHADYPKVSSVAKCFANELCKVIDDSTKVNPSRTANSVEGGVAVVYSRKNGFLKKQYQEVFIECYNDSTAVITFTKNYKLQKTNEVSLENTKIVLDYITELYKS